MTQNGIPEQTSSGCLSRLPQLVIGILVVGVVIVVVGGYTQKDWYWVGVVRDPHATSTPGGTFAPYRTLWDWLQLIVVPAALVLASVTFSTRQKTREEAFQRFLHDEEVRADADRRRDTLLVEYAKGVDTYFAERHDLRDDPVARLQWRTINALSQLDPDGKRRLLDLLGNNHLLTGEEGNPPVIVLTGAHLEAVYLLGMDLTGANLSDAWLEGADLRYAKLERADLSGAKLWNASLGNARLQAASLRGAELVCANLRQAQFAGTDMANSTLFGADLRETNLAEGADVRASHYNSDTQSPDSFNWNTKWPAGFDPVRAEAQRDTITAATMKVIFHATSRALWD